ncbi:MAG: glycosyltransferase [Lentisphaeria bacterium]|nr:glycosyltransferase [Lentisphaeria bacterium]NQZ68972.1 glycosyltransferase [Lentisphaeria bacterium]
MNLDKITENFVKNHPDDCSHILALRWQKLFYLSIILIFLGALAYRWDILLHVVNSFFVILYLGVILFRLCAFALSILAKGHIEISEDKIKALGDLPIYTILVPLYKEANIANKIVKNINLLDYPKDKLDIKLLLEEDDKETREALEKLTLPDYYDIIIVPDADLKTKPRACNWGLEKAKGEYCVIYDAEDRPEPDQLKKAIVAFQEVDLDVACLQAKLNYYNATQNFLTRWFTIEYTSTFDYYLPGLQMMNVPVPLGGTSNHFKTSILKEIGGWDPFNVTEDCDLGVRIYKKGYKTRMLDSTTWEEANSNTWNWIRQRSRWVKGFFQTHLTHSRHPLKMLKELGPWGYAGFLLSVGGSSFMLLANMIYWFVGIVYSAFLLSAINAGYTIQQVIQGPREIETMAWPLLYYGPKEDPFYSTLSICFFVITIVLLLSNFLLIFIHIIAAKKRGIPSLLFWAALMPFYWVLISIGAWKGFFQLLTNPFYWEKTEHGLNDDIEDSDEPLKKLEKVSSKS